MSEANDKKKTGRERVEISSYNKKKKTKTDNIDRLKQKLEKIEK